MHSKISIIRHARGMPGAGNLKIPGGGWRLHMVVARGGGRRRQHKVVAHGGSGAEWWMVAAQWQWWGAG